jgi:hypothetical protein
VCGGPVGEHRARAAGGDGAARLAGPLGCGVVRYPVLVPRRWVAGVPGAAGHRPHSHACETMAARGPALSSVVWKGPRPKPPGERQATVSATERPCGGRGEEGEASRPRRCQDHGGARALGQPNPAWLFPGNSGGRGCVESFGRAGIKSDAAGMLTANRASKNQTSLNGVGCAAVLGPVGLRATGTAHPPGKTPQVCRSAGVGGVVQAGHDPRLRWLRGLRAASAGLLGFGSAVAVARAWRRGWCAAAKALSATRGAPKCFPPCANRGRGAGTSKPPGWHIVSLAARYPWGETVAQPPGPVVVFAAAKGAGQPGQRNPNAGVFLGVPVWSFAAGASVAG